MRRSRSRRKAVSAAFRTQGHSSARASPTSALPFVVAQAHKMVPPEDNGGFAAHKLIDAVEAAFELPFEFGLARESRLFDELVRSAPSAALRHVFFAERELAKIPGLPAAEPLEIKKAGVIGAGTMGTGIAITFAQAGIPVHVVESNEEAIDKAKQTVMGMFMYQVQKGRMTQEEAWKRGQSMQFTDDYNELADADVVVEAVFENMDVKKEVFAQARRDRETRRHSRHEHLDARHRRDGRGDQASRQIHRSALLRAGQHHEAARDRARQGHVAAKRSRPRSSSARRCAKPRCFRRMRSGSSATAWSSTTRAKRSSSPKKASRRCASMR